MCGVGAVGVVLVYEMRDEGPVHHRVGHQAVKVLAEEGGTDGRSGGEGGGRGGVAWAGARGGTEERADCGAGEVTASSLHNGVEIGQWARTTLKSIGIAWAIAWRSEGVSRCSAAPPTRTLIGESMGTIDTPHKNRDEGGGEADMAQLLLEILQLSRILADTAVVEPVNL